jgi:hypothetical protein
MTRLVYMLNIINSEKFILAFVIILSIFLRASNITFDLPQGRGLEHLEIMRA